VENDLSVDVARVLDFNVHLSIAIFRREKGVDCVHHVVTASVKGRVVQKTGLVDDVALQLLLQKFSHLLVGTLG